MNGTVVKLEYFNHNTMKNMSQNHPVNQGIAQDKVKIDGKELTLTQNGSSPHVKTKQFICNVCNKQFTRQDSFNSHTNMHTKSKKNYVCHMQ